VPPFNKKNLLQKIIFMNALSANKRFFHAREEENMSWFRPQLIVLPH
jgi:hypothetical protein